MEVASSGKTKKQPKYITKKTEFKFLHQLIKRHKIALGKGKGFNIQAIVNTLKIDPKTARKWLETPKIQKAIVDEIGFYIDKMQTTGVDDWRQWAKQVELAQEMNEKLASQSYSQMNIVINTDSDKKSLEIVSD